MAVSKWEKRFSSFACRHRYAYSCQYLKYGYVGFRIESIDRIDHKNKLRALNRMRNVFIEESIEPCKYYYGKFLVMDGTEYADIQAKNAAAAAKNEAWWQFHQYALECGLDSYEADRYAEAMFAAC